MKKKIALVLSMVLLVVCTVSATLAWLNDKTDTITNTFTVGNVDIKLEETGLEDNETEQDFKMTPGSEISKDPTVTVIADSEKCYVFVKIEKSANLGTYIDYEVNAAWDSLSGETDVYYQIIDTATTDTALNVIGHTDDEGKWVNDVILVKDTVSNTEMDAADANAPTLKFTAYAVQFENMENVAAAWTAAQAASEYGA